MKKILFMFTLLVLICAGSAQAQTCNALTATIVGTDLTETIEGTEGNDVIVAGDGNDTINGNGGDDVICGGLGGDIINGGDGNDQIFGENGWDTLNGGGDDDVIQAGTGNDWCDGGTGTDSVASDCETVSNIDVEIIPVTLFAADATQLDGALYRPINDALAGIGIRDVALVVSHGAMGTFDSSVPELWGLYGAPQGFTVLALNRRDFGETGGGGAVLFEDTTMDLGPGVDLLAAIGFSEIVLAGHSQGTQNAGIYPSFTGDPRIAAVALNGTVQDGRDTAENLLFSQCPFACYADNVALSEQLIADGFGDDVIGWNTIFNVQLFRSPNNFLSFWGPDTLSVMEREITNLDIPALLLLTEGDNFTPARMSQAVFDAGIAAGVDVEYVTIPQPPGYVEGDNGGNAHGFLATERAMVAETTAFLAPRVPATNQSATGLTFPELQGENYSPVADAGVNQVVPNGAAVMLDGTNSVDVDGSIMTYFWDQIGGTNVTLDDTGSAMPGFTAPAQNQTLTFRLMATDDDGVSDQDTVDVIVGAPLTLTQTYTVPTGTQNIVYYWDGIAASGGLPPYTFDVTGGSLPAGLTLQSAPFDATLATIWGTPTDPTVKSGQDFVVEVTDANGTKTTLALNIKVLLNVGGVGCTNCHAGAGM